MAGIQKQTHTWTLTLMIIINRYKSDIHPCMEVTMRGETCFIISEGSSGGDDATDVGDEEREVTTGAPLMETVRI